MGGAKEMPFPIPVRRLRPFKRPFAGARTDGRPANGTTFRCMYVVFAFESNLGDDQWLEKEYQRVVNAAAAARAQLNAIDRVIVLGKGIISAPQKAGRTVAADPAGGIATGGER